jgi:predicted small lipoprotein YifL
MIFRVNIQVQLLEGFFHCQQNSIGQLIIFYVIHPLHLFAFIAKDAIIERSGFKEIKIMHAASLSVGILGLSVLLLAGCGQKGPLTLPKDPPPAAQPAPAKPAASQPVQSDQQG